MGSQGKPHAVCIPYPAQGHINPMLKLAKLLHHSGFHITFVHTAYNHNRLLKTNGPESLDGLPDFQFETIPDGLPQSDADVTQDIPALCESTMRTCLPPCWIVRLANYVREIPEWYPSDRWQRKLSVTQEIIRKVKTHRFIVETLLQPLQQAENHLPSGHSRRASRSMLLMKEYACRLLHFVSLSDS
ncbi:unnamed protein product [Rhodiola kirilowii]